MASAKDQRVNNRFNQVEKIANRANSEVEIVKADLETTHFDLLEKIKKLEDLVKNIQLDGRPL